MARAGNVVLVEQLDEPRPDDADRDREWRNRPIGVLAATAIASADFPLPVIDDREVLRFWTFGRSHDGRPSLPLVAAQAYLATAYDDLRAGFTASHPGFAGRLPENHAALLASHDLTGLMRDIREEFVRDTNLRNELSLHAETLPERRREQLLALVDLYGAGHHRYFNLHGPSGTLRTVDYDAVLRGEVSDFAGQVVFVGLVEPIRSELDDKFWTPYSTEDYTLSGVELAATAFANFVDGSAIKELSLAHYRGALAAFGLLLGLMLGRLRLSGAFAAAVCFGAAYIAFAGWQFSAAGVWWPLFVPIGVQLPVAIGVVFASRYRQVQAQRERVQRALGAYVPAAVVERLSRDSADKGKERELLHGTCLFTDAQDYTRVAESLSPEALAQLLDEYYETLFAVVTRRGGVVSDAGGDSMVAVWAANAPDPAARTQACAAAIDLLAAADDFNARRGALALPTRVGLESGRMMLGNVGTERRLEYRAIGDIVNTASRIEGLNRLLGTRALASAAAIATTGCKARELGTFLLRGKAVPVDVFELLEHGRASEDAAYDERFAHALGRFRAGSWQAALAGFNALAAEFPNDGPTRYYAGLAGVYAAAPPPTWGGVVAIATK
jgi:adenylate cyclase